MKIWIDLANSPHVPFFRALADEFARRGHTMEVTAREFAQTVEMARMAGFEPIVIGGHGGRKLAGKAQNIFGRTLDLRKWARGRGFDLAVSHNSYAQTAAARILGIRAVTLMDYEHQPANHLAFRMANRVIVPRSFPESALRKFGAAARKVRRYDGIKEDVYLADFQPDPRVPERLRELGVPSSDILVTVRPPARDALYHRFENQLFDELLARLGTQPGLKVIFLARTADQLDHYRHALAPNFIVPDHALDGSNLIAHSDLVVSAGGTMNREAAALGTPAATIYAGRWAALDEQLVHEGRLQRITDVADLDKLPLRKKTASTARRATTVLSQVADLILAT
jgi:predicted glycosyltransferase